MVRLSNNTIVVLAKYYTSKEKDEDKKWSATAAYASNRLQFWVRKTLEDSPNLPIPRIPEDFSFTAEEIRDHYIYLKDSNHEDYKRWDCVEEHDFDHPNIQLILSGGDVGRLPDWYDLPANIWGEGTEKFTDDEPHGLKRAINKMSGWFEESS